MSSETGTKETCITNARILASRANGAKSRGPVSSEGKAASSRNSLRHGLLSKSLVLDAEAAERFQWILQSLIQTFQPANDAELFLVEDMASYRWRMLRSMATETADMNERIRQAYQPGLKPATCAAHALRDGEKSGDSPDHYRRYEASFQRMYLRAQRELLHLQSRRSQLRTAASELLPSWATSPGADSTFDDAPPICETNPSPAPEPEMQQTPPENPAPHVSEPQPEPVPTTSQSPIRPFGQRYIEPRRERWLQRVTGTSKTNPADPPEPGNASD